jgi:hypothetical protein
MMRLFSTKIQLLALVFAVFCLFLWIGVNVYAEDKHPCADDIAKFCKDVKPGGGRIANCLKEHEKDLSPACTKRNEEMKMEAKAMHKACADDMDKYCKDVQPGKGNIMRCLMGHKDELSSACRGELGKMKQKKD